MTRRDLARMLGFGLLASGPSLARGQDFGRLLEQVARDSLRDTFSLQGVERMLTPPSKGEMVTVRTADGWNLVAHRYRPPQGPRPGTLPVILCHGLMYSAQFWDIEPSVSLAEYLRQAGHDVWAVDLRGCGQSQKWVFRMDRAPDALVGGAIRRATRGQLAPTGFATVDPKYANWSLDDHVNYDLHALTWLVKRQTGMPEVAWIGHSMGGIIALCHLAKYRNPGIARLATIGSQVTMNDAQLVLPFLEEMLRARQRQLVGTLRPEELVAMTQSSVNNLFFNVNHVSSKVYSELAVERTDIPSIGLMKQYLTLSTEGELYDDSRRFNYARALGNVQVPLLVACGSLDRFAPPAVQSYIHERAGSTDKSFLVFGRRQGFAADSGHDDALVGLTSRQQVYPLLEAWLRGEKIA